MRHAVYLPPIGAFGDVNVLVELAVASEEAGWDGFFLWDHIQYERPVPLADAWVTLSAIAVSTKTIRLGPLVTPLARRRPWKVAREAVTLDRLSSGRLVLGVGLGIPIWSAALWPPAHPGPVERAARCDGVMPFTGAALTPDEAAHVRDTVADERGDDSFDLCVWGTPDHADGYESAGVTWLVQADGPEDDLADTRRRITAGPPRRSPGG